MTIELTVLAWSVVLGLAYGLQAAGLATQQRGLQWNAGNRDGEARPLTGVVARAGRASRNFLQTFVFFAAAVLPVALTHRNTEHTALGAQVHVWARVAYWPVYAAGIPYLRTLIWIAAFRGFLQVLEVLF